MKQWWREFKTTSNFRICKNTRTREYYLFPTWDIAIALVLNFVLAVGLVLARFEPPMRLSVWDAIIIWLIIRGLFTLGKVLLNKGRP